VEQLQGDALDLASQLFRLADAIPTLKPWRIKLATKGSGVYESDLLDSREERDQQTEYRVVQQKANVQKPRQTFLVSGLLPRMAEFGTTT